MNPFDIRYLKPSDYKHCLSIWNKCNLVLKTSETLKDFEKFLKYNPTTSLALINNDKIIGCVLGGYEGRRGLVHHLAIDPDYQKTGLGKYLMENLEKEFKKLGVDKISFWVLKDNTGVIGFYENQGHHLRQDLVTLSKIL